MALDNLSMTPRYREDALRQLLEGLHQRLPNARGSVIVDNTGLLLTSYPPGKDDDSPTGGDQVAAMAAVLLGLAGKTLGRLAQGQVGRVLIEAEQGTLVVVPATGDTALAVLIDRAAKVGLALTVVRRCAAQIRAVIE
jgi:predicted regulator of Ras-like GTPase activity (Roadblock/LC7/MglB family)